MPSFRQMNLSEIFHHAAASTEDAVDIARRRIWKRLGRNRPKQIAAYRGYETQESIRISGRVLANKPGGGPLDDDGWWENLVNTYQRWESDEVPFAEVIVRYGNEEIRTKADDEGYYHIDFPVSPSHREGLVWKTASVRSGSGDEEIHAIHHIMAVPPTAEYGIISDLDDTVIHTGITSMLLAAKLTFLENAKTRKPLDGVAELYTALQNGNRGIPTNPIFYVSSSPWNLHDLLEDFLQLNDIPPGPMMLRDVGIDRAKFIKSKGHGHKGDNALRIIDSYPDLPFILIGDSGQEDPEIYMDVVKKRPGRVKAIYIRDVNPDADSEHDISVQKSVAEAQVQGVPMIYARDSRAMAEHATAIGLMPAKETKVISAGVEADENRLGTAAKALESITDVAK